MPNRNDIRYENEDKFYDGIAALIARGLTFTSDGDNLIITLTYGY